MNVIEKPSAAKSSGNRKLIENDKSLDVYSDSTESATRWPWIILASLVLSAAILFISQLEDTVEINELITPPSLPEVSVVEVTASAEQVEIQSLSEVKPRWSINLSASISGKVEKVFEGALAGESVKVGEPLIEIENSRYFAQLAAAEQALKEAKLAQLQAENATHLAREDFKRNGREPPNDLALKLPQLGIAKSAVASAEASKNAALKQFEDTLVTAPFDAYVTERYISPGQTITAGDRLVRLVDKSAFELVTEISLRDWALLRKPVKGQIAQVLDQDDQEIAKAKVRRGGGFLDEQTRLFKLFLDIENPAAESVLSGDFVSIRLKGVIAERAFDIPASSLTQEGYIWQVDEEDRLQRIEPEILFERHDRIIIKAPDGISQWRVAVTPLASFLPGQTINPKLVGN